MTREDFEAVVARVLELWPGPTFARKWNHANQTIAFRKLSPFAQHEVLDCIENHRYDNSDAREPRFDVITAKLWTVRRAREGQKQTEASSSLPSWPTTVAWADRKSDGDLAHLWQVVTERYQSVADASDKLWRFLNACAPRSGACLTIMWAVEHNVPLTFKRGTDEWFAVMDEYDRQQKKKEVEEHKRRAAKVAQPVVATAASGSQDEVPF